MMKIERRGLLGGLVAGLLGAWSGPDRSWSMYTDAPRLRALQDEAAREAAEANETLREIRLCVEQKRAQTTVEILREVKAGRLSPDDVIVEGHHLRERYPSKAVLSWHCPVCRTVGILPKDPPESHRCRGFDAVRSPNLAKATGYFDGDRWWWRRAVKS